MKWLALSLTAAAAAWLASAAAQTAPDWADVAAERAASMDHPTHLGLPPMVHPADNPPTPEKISLGRKLFFDRRLSMNGTMSCAMCHAPEQGFSSNELRTAVGVEGRSTKRNTPTSLNVGFYENLFVDGRDPALETQYISPLIARNEMANASAGRVIALLGRLPDYAGLFEDAFEAGPSLDRVGMALAAYQRSLIAGGSPFDRWRYGGDESAISAAAKRGFDLFTGEAGCAGCHLIEDNYALFTDQQFHDIGYGWRREQLRQHPPATELVQVAPGVVYRLPRSTIDSVGRPREPDLGRYEVTEDPIDRWRFRTPSLRNVAVTAPYMHDGGFSILQEVLTFYNGGGAPHDGQHGAIRPLELTPEQLDDLEAFLRSLTSPYIDALIQDARSAPPDNW